MSKLFHIIQNIKDYGLSHELDKYREMKYFKKAMKEKEKREFSTDYDNLSQKELEEVFMPHPIESNRTFDKIIGPDGIKKALLGSIYGDIMGFLYEGSRPEKTITPADLLKILRKGRFTDDTVLTIASCDAIKNEKLFEEVYDDWADRYPGAGYGGAFFNWVLDDVKKPYNSFGNGSAMRVSPCAIYTDDCREIIRLAYESAKVTHNHFEGIKGAVVTAVCIYLARFYAKEDIEAYLIRQYGQKKQNDFLSELYRSALYPSKEYDAYLKNYSEYYYNPHLTFDRMKNMQKAWPISCMDTVPFSIRCAIDSTDYEDFICNIFNYGADTDTEACIGGTIAAILYGLPDKYSSDPNMLKTWLKEDMINTIMSFSDDSGKFKINKKYTDL